MACLDIFTKFATVVPIRSKKTDDYLAGFMECIKTMGKKPTFILSDDEPALNSKDVLVYLETEGIEKLTTRSHAHVVERFIRTFKFLLYKRIDHELKQGKENVQWTNYIFAVLTTYNLKNDHSSIGMTPAEAKRDNNKIDAKINMELKAKHSRKYPPLEVGNKVKIMLKYSKFKKRKRPDFFR